MESIMPQSPAPTPTDSPSACERHVFVYGTLRRGDDNDINRLHPPPRYVGHALVAGTMYHLGRYPGILLDAPGESAPGESAPGVFGEVYAIAPELEPVLDTIEMILPVPTGEYCKRSIRVSVEGRALDCLVYEINPAYVVGKRVIASGDWCADR